MHTVILVVSYYCAKSKVIPKATPLHIACRFGHIEAVKALSTHADLNKQDQVTILSSDVKQY